MSKTTQTTGQKMTTLANETTGTHTGGSDSPMSISYPSGSILNPSCASAPAYLVSFARRVMVTIANDPSTLAYDGKAWINKVWARGFSAGGPGGNPAMDFSDFQARLINAQRHGLVRLSRCDMVEAFARKDVQASDTFYMGCTFNFIRVG